MIEINKNNHYRISISILDSLGRFNVKNGTTGYVVEDISFCLEFEWMKIILLFF